MSEIKITLAFENRGDGGLRVWSPELPGLVLSHPDPFLVIDDISRALAGLFYPLREGPLKGLFEKETVTE